MLFRPGILGSARRAYAVLLAFAAGLLLPFLGGGQALAASPISWSAAQRVAAARAGNPGLGSVSCPSQSLCVATDGAGDLAVSTDPTAGASAWSVAHVDGKVPIITVSCPSSALCVAGDEKGDVMTSSDPAGGASAWQLAHIDGKNVAGGISALSCPSSGLCVAFNETRLFVSSNPTAGPSAWGAGGGVPAADTPSSLSCPATTLCVAATDTSSYLTSTDPAGGSSAWKSELFPFTPQSDSMAFERPEISSVSCASSTLCVGVGGANLPKKAAVYVVSSNPAGGAGAWVSSTLPTPSGGATETYEPDARPSEPKEISCTAPSLCVAIGSYGVLASTTNPTGGTAAWSVASIDVGAPLSGVSCPSVSLCVAVDGDGEELSSTTPAGSAGSWSVTRIAGAIEITGIACPAANLCVGVDDYGEILASTDPRAGRATWHLASISTARLSGVTCPSSKLCVAWGQQGVEISTNPAGGAAAWALSTLGTSSTVDAVSCPAVSLCVAVAGPDNESDPSAILTTRDASAGSGAHWAVAATSVDAFHTGKFVPEFGPAPRITGLSCPSVKLCVAVDSGGWTAVSTHPGSSGGWSIREIDPTLGETSGTPRLTAVACPSVRLCVAVDDFGGILSSTHPAGGARRWSRAGAPDQGGGGAAFTDVSCASRSLCVYVGTPHDNAVISDGSPSRPSYSGSQIDGHHTITAVACAPTKICVAAGQNASVIIGRRHAPQRHPTRR